MEKAHRLATDLLERLKDAAPDSRNSPQLLNELRAKTLTARASALINRANTSLQPKPGEKDAAPAAKAAARADLSAAGADLSKARDLQPNAPASYVNLAGVALTEGKADEAVQHYERALQLDAASFDALNGLVNLNMGQGRFDQAHARVDQAIAARPNAASFYFLKAQIYGQQQDAQNAEAALNRTLELDPNFIPALNSLGALYIRTSRPEEALEKFELMTRKRPDDPTPYMLIGMVQDGRKDYDKSIDAYKRALTLNADAAFAANNLAWNYAEHGKGNLDEAIRLAQGVVQKFPNEPGYADTLGWVYYKKGLHAAAIEQLQKAVRQVTAAKTDSALYRYHLGAALAAAGRKGEARQQLQQALNMPQGGKLTPEQSVEVRKILGSLG